MQERLRHFLHLDESPHELAKAFAVGVFVAFTPFMGLHTFIVLLLAWAFRLNKAAAITGTLVNNPWTIIFIFIAPTWAAAVVMRKMGIDVPSLRYDTLAMHFQAVEDNYNVWELDFWRALIKEFRPYLHAFFLGTALAGAVASLTSYFAAYSWVKIYRKEKAKLKRMKTHD